MVKETQDKMAEKPEAPGGSSGWNSGASHMNEAFPRMCFDQLGLLSMLTTVRLAQ